jgi:carboxyl-terminal processing protease
MKSGKMPITKRNISILATILGLIALLLGPLAPALHGAGLSEEEMKLLNTAVEQIRSHALVAPKSTRKMTDDILRAYANSIDEYADYLTREEYAAFQESSSSDYFGVQMDIQKKDGVILLFPFKGGIAENSRIKAGDELIAVNGSPVFGKSVYVVGAQIRGAEGLTVQLTLRSGQGIPRVLTLRRHKTTYESVSWKTTGATHLIQISRFAKNTEEQLRHTLDTIGADGKTMVIDLRRNQGGSLRIAWECADLFLEKGTVLFKLRSRDETKEIVADQPQRIDNPVILIQDGSTASAAEAFVAALTRNGRALSVGRKSFGKGLAQRFLPLPGGSALLLTYAEIITPDNVGYHNQGLEPDLRLSEELVDEDFSQGASLSRLLDFIKMHQK